MKDLLTHAYWHSYAVGAYNLVSLDFLKPILLSAERRRAPIILSLTETNFDYLGFELAAVATVAAAHRTQVPIAIHLDHGTSLESAVRAIRYGCNGVKVDASLHNIEENITMTRAVVDMTHSCGVPVEGEFGCVLDMVGGEAEMHSREFAISFEEEAKTYVQRTGVDFLSVSSPVHDALKLDLECLARINDALCIPLVVRSGYGLRDERYRKLLACGIAMINFDTVLADVVVAHLRENTLSVQDGGYLDLMCGIGSVIQAEVERSIQLCGSAGRAESVLADVRPWREVEHLIIYNSNGITPVEIEQIAARGREQLSKIPGVRQVLTGQALKPDAQYSYCWLVRFANAAVVESYRHHPDHVAFADVEFRPIANDRISIDYELQRSN